jgi:hypothetical protein
MPRWLPIALTLIAFDALWTVCVFGTGTGWWWVGPALVALSLAVHLARSPAPTREAAVVVLGAMVGTLADAASRRAGLFTVRADAQAARPGLAFLVIFSALWINFGTTVRPCLAWLWRRPWVAALLGAVSGPLAYWIASRIGAVTPAPPAWRWFAAVAAQYAIILPAWLWLAGRVFSGRGAGAGRSSAPGATP